MINDPRPEILDKAYALLLQAHRQARAETPDLLTALIFDMLRLAFAYLQVAEDERNRTKESADGANPLERPAGSAGADQ
jgi:hypothetical protein